jgi:hypothetical protein
MLIKKLKIKNKLGTVAQTLATKEAEFRRITV